MPYVRVSDYDVTPQIDRRLAKGGLPEVRLKRNKICR